MISACIYSRQEAHLLVLQDITPGISPKFQLCKRVNSVQEAFAAIKGKAFIVETKFDGGLRRLLGLAVGTITSG